MTDSVVEPAREQLAAVLAARIAAGRRQRPGAIPPRLDPDAPVPLSPIQRRLWFLWQLDPANAAYHLPLVVRLRGPVAHDALLGALADLLDRHEVLRGVVTVHDGEPSIAVGPAQAVPVVVAPPGPDRPPLSHLLTAEATTPFALDAEPPCRVLVVPLADDDYAVALTLHHIATDGRSQDLLLRDLAQLYAARLGVRNPPPAPQLQYGDVVDWQHRHQDEAEQARQLDWWAEHLAGVPPVLELPADRPRPDRPQWSSDLLPVEPPGPLVEAIRATARAAGCTPFVVLLAGLQMLLSRLAATDDVVVGMPETGRRLPGTDEVTGCFLNTLVVRGDLSGDPTGRQLLHRVRDQVLGALDHATVPFERIVERVRPERHLGATPLYQVQLNLHDEAPLPRFPGLRVEVGYTPVGAAKFDLAFELTDAGPGGPLRGTVEFRTELFDQPTAARFRDWYLAVVAGLLSDLDRPVSAVPLEPVAGPLLRGPARERPPASLVDLFGRWVAQRPDAVAVVGPDGSATYGELSRRAHRIAHRLLAGDVRPEEPVGVLVEPGVDLAAAIVGILTAGAAYLPIDPSYPRGRVAAMLATAGVRQVVTGTGLARQLPPEVSALFPPGPGEAPDDRPQVTVTADQLGHVIFTSGSTGEPKGVAVTHAGIVNCVAGMLERTPQLSGRAFAIVSTIAADLGLASFYGALLSGGTLHLLARQTANDPESYAHYLAEHPVDVVKCVPSQIGMLATYGDLSAVLPRQVLILAGEAVPWELVDRIRAVRPDLMVQTHYGPTECSMFSFVSDVDDLPRAAGGAWVPLGTLLPNIGCHVLDRAGRPLPAGVPGELALTGPGVSRGYLNRPEFTAERFGPDPTGDGRCYRTGDLARVHPGTGVVEFLGRADDQVQVRGFRVELGEVVTACRAVAGAADAVVLPTGQGHERRLAAWLVAPSGLDERVVRARLRETLPYYAVPATLSVVDRLPLTPNGKVDRAALQSMLPGSANEYAVPATDATGSGIDAPPVAPRTAIEVAVARAWREVLERSEVSVEDDFFAIGGHSFAATRVAGRLRQELSRDVPLRLLFEHPVLADLAAALSPPAREDGTLSNLDDSVVGPSPSDGAIPRRDPDRPTPLSSVQARLWFLTQLEPESSAYHIPILLRLRGDLDAGALDGAVRDLVTRHEVLRSVVAERDGALCLETLPPDVVVMSTVDTTPDGLAGAAAVVAQRPFRLDREPPLRVVLFRVAGDGYALGITFHHIAADAWSLDVVLTEIATAYAVRLGRAAPLPPLPAQYGDYTAWLQGRPDGEASVEWWVARLTGAPPVLELPTDRPRPPVASAAGGAVPVTLRPPLVAGLRDVARRAGCTPFMVLLTAWQALLGRLAAADEVVVGVPESGRHHPDTEALVGCFVNTLALRTDLRGDPTGAQLLARVRDVALAGFAHAYAPLERVVERLQVDRDPSSTPLFQVLLNVLEQQRATPVFPGLTAEVLGRPEPASKYDLSLTLAAIGDGYEGTVTFRRDLFEPETVRRWVQWYESLLTSLLADPDQPVGRIPLEPVTGPLFAGPPLPPDGPPVTEPPFRLIERCAEAEPEALAVVGPDRRLTYRELDQRANQVAHALIAAGVRAEQPVGVLLEPSADLVVALLAIHKAGACYLPFDVSFPTGRIETLCGTAGAPVVLTVAEFADRTGGRGMVLDDPATLAGQPHHRPDRTVAPADLAHIVFTSGSTGVPKGVAVEHRSVAHYLACAMDRLGHDVAGGSFAIVSTPAADLGLTAVFVPLTTGGVTHVVAREVATDPEALAAYIENHQMDVLKLVPSHLELLASHGSLAAVLPRRLLILTGEALSWDLVDRIRLVRPDLRIQNHYGHTETTLSSVMCDVDEVPPQQRRSIVPLGRALPGVRGYLVDRSGQPVPPGIPGELWLAGPGLAREYVGDPALTASRFVPDPVDGTVRCYRSGDQLRVRLDGTIEYLGRADDQVKIRGHRVELGEVVAALRAVPDVAEAVVLPVGDGHLRTLAAWAVARPGATLDPGAVRGCMRERLPEHQVPAAIVVLQRLPLNPNGKVDRAALPAPGPVAARHAPPENPTQQRIADTWGRLLAMDEIGLDDDFFALGGDSFTAVRAVRGIDPGLRVIDLFTHPTVRELAAFLDDREGDRDRDGDEAAGGARLLHRLAGPAAKAQLTVVCVPYGGGLAAAFRPLAAELTRAEPGAAVLAVELPGHDPARPDEPVVTMPELVERVAAELTEAGTSGPVVFYGHCVGTAAAIALARRWEADGGEVGGVVLAGGFPSARLPGRIPTFVNRVFGTDRWASNRTARDALRTMGGLLDDMDETASATMLAGMRHDSREARAWYTRELADPGPRLRAPALCLVGEKDPITEFYEERYQEWGAFAEQVELASLPRAGHYFLKYQAAEVASLISQALSRWRGGTLPATVEPDEVPVIGRQARAALRSFYLLATGQLVALVGWALSNFALSYWAYQESGRVSDYALVVMLALVPAALLAPVGGAVADRYDRRTVMVVSYAVSAVVMLALAGLLATDSLSLVSVSVIVGITSVLSAFHQPAFLAVIAQLVPKPYLPQANAVAQLGTGVSQLVAPVAGGALIAVFGLAPVVGLNVVAFALGIATLLAVRVPARMFHRLEEPLRRAIVGGWRFVVKRRPLVVMTCFFMVVNFFTAIMWVSVAPLVLSAGGPAALGVVTSVGWAGAVLGAVAVVPWGGTRRRAIGMLAFTVVSGVGMVVMGIVPVLAVVAIGFAIRLASMTMINVHWLALIQVKVGHELQGRVLATNLMISLAIQPLGFLAAGPLADRVFGPLLSEGGALAGSVGQIVGVGPGRGVALMLVCAGVLLAIWGVLGFCYRPMRLLEDDLPDAVPGSEISEDLDEVQADADRRLVRS